MPLAGALDVSASFGGWRLPRQPRTDLTSFRLERSETLPCNDADFLSSTASGRHRGCLTAALPLAATGAGRPKDVLVVANEFGPNSLDIHTVGANRPATA
jgi:hypothetical protein